MCFPGLVDQLQRIGVQCHGGVNEFEDVEATLSRFIA